jgi:hypothetical protein
MSNVTLDAPLTMDPSQAVRLVLRSSEIDFEALTMRLTVDFVAADNRILARRVITVDGPAVQTYIANQKTTIATRLMAKLGVTGTVG